MMRRIQLLRSAAVLLALATCAATRAGEVERDGIRSRALGREIPMTVYLPTGYQAQAAPFPVVYLLHGAGGDESNWVRMGGAKETLDGLVERGLMRPSVVVMPTAGPGSWWVDGVVDKAEKAIVGELLPYVEGKYKVRKDRGGRALGGLSMGGYGALNLALRYPEKFCGAALISPAIYDPIPPESSDARKAAQFARQGKFDPETWKALNYPTHLDRYRQASAKVSIWIVAGDHDFLGIARESAQLYGRLSEIQPKQVELRIVEGDHEWMLFRDALPDALQYVDRQCAREG